jgi:uncharacterized membrane protein YeaQ/YmgE (transglycosylase-associated protein family)
MSFIAWIALGLISGFIGSKIVNKRGSGMVLDIVLGIVGAVVAGILLSMAGMTGITGFNLWSVFVSVAGSVVVLASYHAMVRPGRA